MHHFFVTPENVSDGEITITGSDVNHIKNVLRMRIGEELLISNGQGQDYLCKLKNLADDMVTCEITDAEFEGCESPAKFYLFQGLPKADKFETVIQKAVELGAFEIVPVETKRTIVKLDAKKKEAKIKRWNSIAESAAKQSRRSIVPEVADVLKFDKALEMAKDFDLNIIPYENFKDMEATRAALSNVKPGMKVGIFIGPEGGFDEAEVDAAIEAGVKPISLGKRILRTETAGLTILSILMFMLE
ncbi:MAG: 16S rRNA (uracil(1498)-N(3))-methyltransferase [Parasporobacterium sp.]|nr:16S rRNA (uracil(1498)-N(3))-methyltransferase [Parasporobacterium sp.]